MVSEALNGKRESMEVVMPGFQGIDYCKEFPIIHIIISFSRGE